LVITETFLIAERIQLGALMDLCATFLDRLEDHYELYEDAAPAEADEVPVVIAQAAADQAEAAATN
jgi:hypothetical protein